jgi:hypothetical protein
MYSPSDWGVWNKDLKEVKPERDKLQDLNGQAYSAGEVTSTLQFFRVAQISRESDLGGESFMDVSDIADLCKNVDQAAQQVRATFRARVETLEVLDRFWWLQDTLARLLEAMDDDSYSIAPACFELIQRIVEVLETADNFHCSSIPAVKSACAAIKQSLIALEQSREGFGQRPRIPSI